MQIKTLKDLKQIIALCRKTGVLSIEVDGVKLLLAPKANKTKKNQVIESNFALEMPLEASIEIPKFQGLPSILPTPDGNISTGSLTEEQLLFYSSQPGENEKFEDAI